MVACYGTTGGAGANWETRVYSDASCQNLVWDSMSPTFCGPDVPNRSPGCDLVTGTVYATGQQTPYEGVPFALGECGNTMVASPPPPPAIGATFHVYQNQDRTDPIATIPTAAGVTFPIYVAPGVCTFTGANYVNVACYGTTGQTGAQLQILSYSDASCQTLDFDNSSPTYCGPDVTGRSSMCDAVSGILFPTGPQGGAPFTVFDCGNTL